VKLLTVRSGILIWRQLAGYRFGKSFTIFDLAITGFGKAGILVKVVGYQRKLHFLYQYILYYIT